MSTNRLLTCEDGFECSDEFKGDQLYQLIAVAIAVTLIPLILPSISNVLSSRVVAFQMGQKRPRHELPGPRAEFVDDGTNVWLMHADPPLVGIVPKTWLDTGLGVMLFILKTGFCVTYVVYLIYLPGGCSGPMGGCGTISCVSGTYVKEGYVFMQLTLTATPLLGVMATHRIYVDQRSMEDGRDLVRHIATFLFQCGMISCTLTALFPDKMTIDPVEDAYNKGKELQSMYDTFTWVHTFGIGVGVILSLIATFSFFLVRFVQATCCARSGRGGRWFIAPSCLAVRILHVGCVLGAVVSFACVKHSGYPADYCPRFVDKQACITGPVDKLPYHCNWTHANETRSLHGLKLDGLSTLQPKCVRSECPLYAYARSIVAEYAVLILSLTYVCTYGLTDLLYLNSNCLVRWSSIQRGSAGSPPRLSPTEVDPTAAPHRGRGGPVIDSPTTVQLAPQRSLGDPMLGGDRA